jgi:hypothetical protein
MGPSGLRIGRLLRSPRAPGRGLGGRSVHRAEALHTAILLDELPAARVPDGSVVTTSLELPGRAGAISELDALFERVEHGCGQVGVVEGEAGIGKSRLLHVWSERLAARGVRVVPVAGDELGRALPLQPLLDAVDELARRAGSGDADQVVGPDIAILGPLIGGQTEPARAAQLAALTDPGAGQALLFAALFSVLRRQAEHEPLVLVIDQRDNSARTATSPRTLNRQRGTVASSITSGLKASQPAIAAPSMAARYCSTGPSLRSSDIVTSW